MRDAGSTVVCCVYNFSHQGAIRLFIIIRHNRGQGTRRIDRFSISLQACYTNCEMKTEKLVEEGTDPRQR